MSAARMRLTVRAVVGAAELGEFSLRPQQGDVRAVFVPLTRLQQDLDVAAAASTRCSCRSADGRTRPMDAMPHLEALVRRRSRSRTSG